MPNGPFAVGFTCLVPILAIVLFSVAWPPGVAAAVELLDPQQWAKTRA
jgi:hypothetical protein